MRGLLGHSSTEKGAVTESLSKYRDPGIEGTYPKQPRLKLGHADRTFNT